MASRDKTIPNYSESLVKNGLQGARIGVLRQAFEGPSVDPEVRAVFNRAIEDLRKAGATVLDTVMIDGLDSIRRAGRGGGRGGGQCAPFKYEFNAWLAQQGEAVPVKSIDTIVRRNQFHPSIQQRLNFPPNADQNPDSVPACQARQRNREAVRSAVTATMDRLQLDGLIYPTWSNPPR